MNKPETNYNFTLISSENGSPPSSQIDRKGDEIQRYLYQKDNLISHVLAGLKDWNLE